MFRDVVEWKQHRKKSGVFFHEENICKRCIFPDKNISSYFGIKITEQAVIRFKEMPFRDRDETINCYFHIFISRNNLL